MYPEIHIFSFFSLPTYLVFNSLLFCCLLVLVEKRSQHRQFSRKIALNLCLFIMLFGLLGARLAHVIVEYPSLYWNHPSQIFRLWEGGYVFYGGAIFAFISCMFYLRITRQDWKLWLDFFSPVLHLGYGLGRIACFLAGCCYGKTCDLPWAIHLATEGPAAIARHPTQIYASLWDLFLAALLWHFERKNVFSKKPSVLFFLGLCLHSLGRILMEQFRDDERGWNLFNLSFSTWISGILFCIAVLQIKKEYKKSLTS